jgi:hypothetical protein
MSDFDNTNRGSIWKNERKTKDTHPDFTGSMNIEGREYFVDGWRRKEGAGPKAPAMTLRVKAKDAQPGGHPDRFRNEPAGSAARLDDDIPFAPEFR